MKKAKLFIPLFLLLLSCSQKSVSNSSFKLVVGRASQSVLLSGGSYVEIEDLNSKVKNLIKLDSENSAIIPYATYNMLFVAFQGPLAGEGNVYCGAVTNVTLSSSAATIAVNINEANCSSSQYQTLIEKLKNNQNSNWDQAKFDQGKWGQ